MEIRFMTVNLSINPSINKKKGKLENYRTDWA